MATQLREFTATDKVFLGYIVLNTAILLWHAREVEGWGWLLLANALAVLLVVLLRRSTRRSALLDFIGGAYPVILTAAYYTQLGNINVDVGVLHDRVVQAWEVALFGGEVSVTWHQRVPNLALSFILHFCYSAYYIILVLPALFLFFARSRESFARGCFIVTLGFYTCYVIFELFPVAGPRYFFGNATGPIAQVATARFEHWLTEGGSAIGTAFPSSHVVASWCAVYALWRDARCLALVLAPVAIGLALGTVYGQFHYAVDALAGALLGVALCALADPLSSAISGRAAPSSS